MMMMMINFIMESADYCCSNRGHRQTAWHNRTTDKPTWSSHKLRLSAGNYIKTFNRRQAAVRGIRIIFNFLELSVLSQEEKGTDGRTAMRCVTWRGPP